MKQWIVVRSVRQDYLDGGLIFCRQNGQVLAFDGARKSLPHGMTRDHHSAFEQTWQLWQFFIQNTNFAFSEQLANLPCLDYRPNSKGHLIALVLHVPLRKFHYVRGPQDYTHCSADHF